MVGATGTGKSTTLASMIQHRNKQVAGGRPFGPSFALNLYGVLIGLPFARAMTEQDIASRYGVSRQPVREAFISLDRAGLLSVRAQRGTLVVRISRERMRAAKAK